MAESDHEPAPGMLGTAIHVGTPPVVEVVFSCCRDGATAGTVGLYGPDGYRWVLVSESFLWKHQMQITGGLADELTQVLARADAGQLFGLGEEFAPFFCAECRAVYCGQCWRKFYVWDDDDPGLLDEIRGMCPAGHERMLSD